VNAALPPYARERRAAAYHRRLMRAPLAD